MAQDAAPGFHGRDLSAVFNLSVPKTLGEATRLQIMRQDTSVKTLNVTFSCDRDEEFILDNIILDGDARNHERKEQRYREALSAFANVDDCLKVATTLPNCGGKSVKTCHHANDQKCSTCFFVSFLFLYYYYC